MMVTTQMSKTIQEENNNEISIQYVRRYMGKTKCLEGMLLWVTPCQWWLTVSIKNEIFISSFAPFSPLDFHSPSPSRISISPARISRSPLWIFGAPPQISTSALQFPLLPTYPITNTPHQNMAVCNVLRESQCCCSLQNVLLVYVMILKKLVDLWPCCNKVGYKYITFNSFYYQGWWNTSHYMTVFCAKQTN